MEKKRCQVCDGPIVNGRCKLCGMPYRNDETLYHLNENRSDHYRHATSRARAIMRQEEIPLGGAGGGQFHRAGDARSALHHARCAAHPRRAEDDHRLLQVV